MSNDLEMVVSDTTIDNREISELVLEIDKGYKKQPSYRDFKHILSNDYKSPSITYHSEHRINETIALKLSQYKQNVLKIDEMAPSDFPINLLTTFENQNYIKWWKSVPILDKLRLFPSEYLSIGMISAFGTTLFFLVSGLIIQRIIIAPDFGIVVLVLTFFFGLMTIVSRFDIGDKNDE